MSMFQYEFDFQAENRYHVPKGTKFYRIKVKPLPHSKDLMRSQHQCSIHNAASSVAAAAVAEAAPIMSQSQTTEQTSSVILSAMPAVESQSVPTSPTKESNLSSTSIPPTQQ